MKSLLRVCLLGALVNIYLSSVYARSQCSVLFYSHFDFELSAEEKLNVRAFYGEIYGLKAKKLAGISISPIAIVSGGPILKIRVQPLTNNHPKKVLITAGVHGSEVSSVQTALRLLQFLIDNPQLREKFDVTIIPNINPSGLKTGRRLTKLEFDLNRWFIAISQVQETLAVMSTVEPDYDLAIDLHEGYLRRRFFFIQNEDDGGFASKVLEQVPKEILLTSTTGKFPAIEAAFTGSKYTLIAPGLAYSNTGGTLKHYLYEQGIKRSYTFEIPGQLDRSFAREIALELLIRMFEKL